MNTISPTSDIAKVIVRSVVRGLKCVSAVNVVATRDMASRRGLISARVRVVGFMPCPTRWNRGSEYFRRSLASAVLTAD